MLAIANAFTTALAVALLIFALMAVVTYPRRTFGLLASLGLIGLALRYPVAAGIVVAAPIAAVTASLVARRKVKPAVLLLTDQRST